MITLEEMFKAEEASDARQHLWGVYDEMITGKYASYATQMSADAKDQMLDEFRRALDCIDDDRIKETVFKVSLSKDTDYHINNPMVICAHLGYTFIVDETEKGKPRIRIIFNEESQVERLTKFFEAIELPIDGNEKANFISRLLKVVDEKGGVEIHFVKWPEFYPRYKDRSGEEVFILNKEHKICAVIEYPSGDDEGSHIVISQPLWGKYVFVRTPEGYTLWRPAKRESSFKDIFTDEKRTRLHVLFGELFYKKD